MLVLLDLDGTLTDPYRGMMRSFRHMFTSVGLPVPAEADLRRLIGPPFQTGLPPLGITAELFDDAVEAYRGLYEVGGASLDADVYTGVIEMMDELRSDGHELALATSKPEHSATKVVNHFGIAERLTFIGGATTDGTRHVKGDVISHVLRSTGVSPDDCIMVGDRDVDVIGAKANGMRAVGVRWGYSDPGELDAHTPFAVVETPVELLSVIRSAAAHSKSCYR
jgi:phosphoglycolate phosphatase